MLAKRRCLLQRLIPISEKDHFRYAQLLAGLTLLFFSNGNKGLGCQAAVAGPFVAIGANHVDNRFSVLCQTCDRSGRAEFSIVRVGCNDHSIKRFLHRCPLSLVTTGIR